MFRLPPVLKPETHKTSFWKKLGPGVVTGASDDDPSGIATYTQAGATLGTSLLWTALFTYPLTVTIQEMCARIGLVTRNGLAGNIKTHFSRTTLWMVVAISFPSIILNIAADIAGMGAVAHMVFPRWSAFTFSIIITVALMYSMVFWSYSRISKILKWLCLTLFCYIIIPFLGKTDWLSTIHDTFWPVFTFSENYFMMLVGILGTTISPYLFFWQTNMEVEELENKGLMVDKYIVKDMRTDVKWGLALTNVVFYFIILSAGSVLYKNGGANINTVEDAAKALRPLAGDSAYILFALGVIGTGLLALPVLAGSLSYMLAETMNWNEGLNKKLPQAKGFYVTLVVSLLLGLLINLLGISPVKMLLWSAVLYGVTAPLLIIIILLLANKKELMGRYTNSRKQNVLGVLTFVVMGTASAIMLYFYLRHS